MAENIAFKITVDTDVADLSIGELRQGFRQLQDEMKGVNIGTEEYRKKLLKLGEVKAVMNDLKQQIIALDPEKRFRAFAQIGSSVASGFAAAQGAMAIFGAESENLQKVLVRVQAAMALAQGLQGLAGMGKALETVRLAMLAFAASNPFTAILTAIIAIGAAIGGMVLAFGDFRSESERALDIAKKDLLVAQERWELAKLQENHMKLMGKSEKEILEFKIKEIEAVIKKSELEIQANARNLKAQLAAEIKNKEILSGAIKFIETPIYLLLKAVDKLGEAFGEQWNLASKFSDSLATLIFDPEEMAKKGVEALKEEQKALAQLQSERDSFQLAINKIDDKAAEDNAKNKEDARKKELKRTTEFEEELARTRMMVQRWLADTEAEEKKKKDAEEEAQWQAKEDIEIKRHEKFKERIKNQLEYQAQLKLQLEKQAITSITGLANTLFENSLQREGLTARQVYEIKKKQFHYNKIASATEAAIDTIGAVQKNYKQGGLAIGSALNIAQIAIGAANVAAILAKKYPPFGGGAADTNTPSPGGGSAPTIQSPFTTNQTGVNQNQQGNFAGFDKPIKAVVVETDITDTQKTIKSIQERTTF